MAELPPCEEMAGGMGTFEGVGTAVCVDPGGRRGGATRCHLRTARPPILNITPPKGGRGGSYEDPDLEEPPELGSGVTCFLRGSIENFGRGGQEDTFS